MAKSKKNVTWPGEEGMPSIRCNMECSSGSRKNDNEMSMARVPGIGLGHIIDDDRGWYGNNRLVNLCILASIP